MSKEMLSKDEYEKALLGHDKLSRKLKAVVLSNNRPYSEYKKDCEAECNMCGSQMCLFEIRQLNDGKYFHLEPINMYLCNGCFDNFKRGLSYKTFIELFHQVY